MPPNGSRMTGDLILVGTSHHRAPVELRERVAVPRDEMEALAQTLAGAEGEAVCLSTCNRTELYVAGADAERRAEAALLELSGLHEDELKPVLYRLRDEAAALHLFRVAAGLDSLVPGEGEILGQVRSAYEAGATGAVLDRVFRQALYAGKKVRAQTAIGESPASVSSAAAALAHQVFGELRGTRILVIGAGKVSELAARNLLSRGAEIAWVANRSVDAAAELARLRTLSGVPQPSHRGLRLPRHPCGLGQQHEFVGVGHRGLPFESMIPVEISVPSLTDDGNRATVTTDDTSHARDDPGRVLAAPAHRASRH